MTLSQQEVVSVTLPDHYYKYLKALASECGVSLAWIVREALIKVYGDIETDAVENFFRHIRLPDKYQIEYRTLVLMYLREDREYDPLWIEDIDALCYLKKHRFLDENNEPILYIRFPDTFEDALRKLREFVREGWIVVNSGEKDVLIPWKGDQHGSPIFSQRCESRQFRA